MTTRNIVPRATGEGSLGTNAKKWGDVYANNIHGDLTGNATSATSATNDADGNNIASMYAPKESPAFTGSPTAPTQAANNNSTRLATTAYVVNDLKANAPLLANNFLTNLTSSDDLDAITTAGTYKWAADSGGAPANIPSSEVQYAKMVVLTTISNGYVDQIVIRHVSGQMYIRSGRVVSGSWTWSAWKHLAYAEDVLPFTGGTMTGTIGSINLNFGMVILQDEELQNPVVRNHTQYLLGVRDKNNTNIGGLYYSITTNNAVSASLVVKRWLNNTSRSVSLYADDSAFSFRPGNDNVIQLGAGSFRWSQLFAGTTTISTSDERMKDNIVAIPDEVLDAWGEVGWYQYQFKDSIAEKGETKARLHTGAIAQRIESVFNAHGLDANRYGLLCYDEWKSEPAERDEDGNIIQEARPAGNRYSLRYEEALCMEAAYQRRRADRLEERIARLESLINNIEK